MPETALSAFSSAARARCCATDSLLREAVRRGRGEMERGRTSCIRCVKAEFGVLDSHCTVTSGGAPSARMDDAVSSMVLSAAAGELTLTDRSGECSDGDDIFTVTVHSQSTQ